MIIQSIKVTCSACPFQLEGSLQTGESLFVWYRYNELLVQINGRDVLHETHPPAGEYGPIFLSREEIFKKMIDLGFDFLPDIDLGKIFGKIQTRRTEQ